MSAVSAEWIPSALKSFLPDVCPASGFLQSVVSGLYWVVAGCVVFLPVVPRALLSVACPLAPSLPP